MEANVKIYKSKFQGGPSQGETILLSNHESEGILKWKESGLQVLEFVFLLSKFTVYLFIYSELSGELFICIDDRRV